jgi:hypothetical protein
MTEQVPERLRSSDAVAITAIVVVGCIVLACIAGTVAVAIAFFANVPW